MGCTLIGQWIRKHGVYSSIGQYTVRRHSVYSDRILKGCLLPLDNSGTGQLCIPYKKVRKHGIYYSRTHVMHLNRTIRHIVYSDKTIEG